MKLLAALVIVIIATPALATDVCLPIRMYKSDPALPRYMPPPGTKLQVHVWGERFEWGLMYSVELTGSSHGVKSGCAWIPDWHGCPSYWVEWVELIQCPDKCPGDQYCVPRCPAECPEGWRPCMASYEGYSSNVIDGADSLLQCINRPEDLVLIATAEMVAAPEPSRVALLGAGVLMLTLLARNKSRC